jgi:hypothetical protein
MPSASDVRRMPTPAERYAEAVRAAQEAYEVYLRRVRETYR